MTYTLQQQQQQQPCQIDTRMKGEALQTEIVLNATNFVISYVNQLML